MKNVVVFLAVLFLAMSRVAAQSDYVVHTIADGETLTQLANQYGTTVGDIMRFNKMTTESKLHVGEVIKIPTQPAQAAQPATHMVAKGETLYQISRKYKVSVTQLRAWNNLSDNTIKVGQVLYLQAPTAVPTNTAATVVTNDVTDNTTTAVPDNATSTVPNMSANPFDDTTTVAAAAPQNTAPPQVAVDPYVAAYQNQQQANAPETNTTGTSGIFKSSKGWNDKNYFILMNDVTPGRMVKIQANGKTIYAKVLWNLGNVKTNDGLTYRISDAAAAALNLTGDTFDIVVSYFKEK